MTIRDEELIDYLMGEADEALIHRVQLALQSDTRVAARLEELRAALGMLDSMKSAIEPPSGLTERTLSFIDDNSEAPKCTPRKSYWGTLDPLAGRSSRTLLETAALALAVIAPLCLILPAIVNARVVARQMRCSQNLHVLSDSLIHAAMLNPERRFPAVPRGLPDSFPGRFVMDLQSHGLMPAPEYLRCYRIPSLDPNAVQYVCIPTHQEFLNASPEEQRKIKQSAAGDYAYSYGLDLEDRVVGLPLDGGSHLILLGDAPEVIGNVDMFNGHEGTGINVCYTDGHVAFRRFSAKQPRQTVGGKQFVLMTEWTGGDYPFRNLEGRLAPGLTIHDASLGPSASEPQ